MSRYLRKVLNMKDRSKIARKKPKTKNNLNKTKSTLEEEKNIREKKVHLPYRNRILFLKKEHTGNLTW